MQRNNYEVRITELETEMFELKNNILPYLKKTINNILADNHIKGRINMPEKNEKQKRLEV